jgi:hypothetical protein
VGGALSACELTPPRDIVVVELGVQPGSLGQRPHRVDRPLRTPGRSGPRGCRLGRQRSTVRCRRGRSPDVGQQVGERTRAASGHPPGLPMRLRAQNGMPWRDPLKKVRASSSSSTLTAARSVEPGLCRAVLGVPSAAYCWPSAMARSPGENVDALLANRSGLSVMHGRWRAIPALSGGARRCTNRRTAGRTRVHPRRNRGGSVLVSSFQRLPIGSPDGGLRGQGRRRMGGSVRPGYCLACLRLSMRPRPLGTAATSSEAA